MRVDPISTVLQDGALRRRLAEERVATAFEGWIEDVVPPTHPRAADIRGEILSKAVEAFLTADDEDAAFLRYRAMGMYAKGGALDAFEDLYRLVDGDIAKVIGQRSVAIGYPGPLDAPTLVRCGPPGIDPATYLAIPVPGMVPEAACAGVEVEAGTPFREPDGSLVWTRMRWHWIRGTVPGAIPDGLVEELVAAVNTPKPPPTAGEALISNILADLLDDSGDGDGMGEFEALCEPDEMAMAVAEARRHLDGIPRLAQSGDSEALSQAVDGLSGCVGKVRELAAASLRREPGAAP